MLALYLYCLYLSLQKGGSVDHTQPTGILIGLILLGLTLWGAIHVQRPRYRDRRP
jgi:hypothetical protein